MKISIEKQTAIRAPRIALATRANGICNACLPSLLYAGKIFSVSLVTGSVASFSGLNSGLACWIEDTPRTPHRTARSTSRRIQYSTKITDQKQLMIANVVEKDGKTK